VVADRKKSKGYSTSNMMMANSYDKDGEDDVSIRGSRSDTQTYFIDGVRVTGSEKPAANQSWAREEEVSAASQNITFLEYDLPQKMSIASDGRNHDIILDQNDINAEYKHYGLPRLDPKTYLIAEIVDWSKYNLSSGIMNLYFEGTYVGKSFLDVSTATDTLTLSLGQDISVSVKKEKIKELCKTAYLSSKKEEKMVYDLIIKNNKSEPITYKLIDQLPLMTNTTMSIDIDQISGAQHDQESGILEWNIVIKPGELIKKRVAYSVKYPKNARVILN
jgi:uncharacterized protein (TIGR02231 family)